MQSPSSVPLRDAFFYMHWLASSQKMSECLDIDLLTASSPYLFTPPVCSRKLKSHWTKAIAQVPLDQLRLIFIFQPGKKDNRTMKYSRVGYFISGVVWPTCAELDTL